MNLSQGTPWRKRRSMGLNMISSQELDITTNGINCVIDLPRQVFSLTYLEDNQTQNPDSLGSLEEFRKKTWKIYLIGYLNNFTYEESQIISLKKALNKALNPEVPTENDFIYVSEVAVTEDLSPTENDNSAIVITVNEVCEVMEYNKEVFKGYLMAWCNPVKVSRTMLPLLLCNGRKKVRTGVLELLCKRYDMVPSPLTLMQEDLRQLSIYSLIMLGESDCGMVMLSYRIPPGDIRLMVPLPDMLKLWSHVHQSDTDEVELGEVHMFHNALELFCESTFGIKLNGAQFQQMKVKGHFSLNINSEILSNSTRILHVLLKYLNYLAAQKLKIKYLEHIHRTTDVSQSCSVAI